LIFISHEISQTANELILVRSFLFKAGLFAKSDSGWATTRVAPTDVCSINKSVEDQQFQNEDESCSHVNGT